MSSPAGASKSQETAKSTRHVDVLPDNASQFYANLHPVLLLSLIPFSFKSLVNDPVNTLLGLAPAVLLVQAIYCVVCLPSSGQNPPTKSKPGEKRKPAKPAQDIWSKIVVRWRSRLVTTSS